MFHWNLIFHLLLLLDIKASLRFDLKSTKNPQQAPKSPFWFAYNAGSKYIRPGGRAVIRQNKTSKLIYRVQRDRCTRIYKRTHGEILQETKWGWLAHGNETNESRGVGDLIGDTNNCVCSTIMLSFCSGSCRAALLHDWVEWAHGSTF